MNIRDPKFKEGDKVLEIGNPKSGVLEVKRISKYDFFTDLYIYELESDDDGISLTSFENNLKPYIEKPKSVWNLKKGDKYYYLSVYCKISEFIWDDTPFDKNVLELGNGFLTKEEAEFELERRKIEVKMLRLGGRRTLDYNDETDVFFIDYNPIHEDVEINSLVPNNSSIQPQGIIYFDFYFDAKEAINKIGKDRIKKYIFGVEE